MYMSEDENLRIAGIEQESFVDGPGIRFVVFTQGCTHHCPECQNPETHAFGKGQVETAIQGTCLKSMNPLVKPLLKMVDIRLVYHECVQGKNNELIRGLYTGILIRIITQRFLCSINHITYQRDGSEAAIPFSQKSKKNILTHRKIKNFLSIVETLLF